MFYSYSLVLASPQSRERGLILFPFYRWRREGAPGWERFKKTYQLSQSLLEEVHNLNLGSFCSKPISIASHGIKNAGKGWWEHEDRLTACLSREVTIRSLRRPSRCRWPGSDSALEDKAHQRGHWAPSTPSLSLRAGQLPLCIRPCATGALEPEHKDFTQPHRRLSRVNAKPEDRQRDGLSNTRIRDRESETKRDKQEPKIESQRQIEIQSETWTHRPTERQSQTWGESKIETEIQRGQEQGTGA